MPSIKSSTDLRNSYNSISTYCRESREPVFITKNGQGDLAVMSIEVYEEITRGCGRTIDDSREELYDLLSEGREAVEAGKTRLHEEVMADIRRRISNGTL